MQMRASRVCAAKFEFAHEEGRDAPCGRNSNKKRALDESKLPRAFRAIVKRTFLVSAILVADFLLAQRENASVPFARKCTEHLR